MKRSNTRRGAPWGGVIQHVVLTNGFRSTHRLDTLDPEILEACRKILPTGGAIPFVNEPYRVEIEGATFTIFRCDCPILAGGIGRGPDQTWKELISLLGEFDLEYHAKPHPRLWLAIVLLPTISAFADEEIGWMFDFQRHLAAVMASSEENKPT